MRAILDSRGFPGHINEMGRKDAARGGGNEYQLAVRIPAELLRAIDDEVERLRLERPGAKVQRSEAVREILYQVLLADEAVASASAKRRKAARRVGSRRVA
jgi:hypothetical protein